MSSVIIENVMVNIDLGQSIDLWKLSRYYPEKVSYRPRQFPGANFKLRYPGSKYGWRGAVTLFESGKANISVSSVAHLHEMVEALRSFLSVSGYIIADDIEVKVHNVVASARLGRAIGCGIVQALFSEAKLSKFGGESLLIKAGGGTLRIFSTGSIVGVGFKTEEDAKRVMTETMTTIIENYDRFPEEKDLYCRIERYGPTMLAYYTMLDEISEEEFPIEQRRQGEEMIQEYLNNRKEKSMGMRPRTMAAAVIYLVSALTMDQCMTQSRVEMITGVKPVSIRNGYKTLIEELGLDSDIIGAKIHAPRRWR